MRPLKARCSRIVRSGTHVHTHTHGAKAQRTQTAYKQYPKVLHALLTQLQIKVTLKAHGAAFSRDCTKCITILSHISGKIGVWSKRAVFTRLLEIKFYTLISHKV